MKLRRWPLSVLRHLERKVSDFRHDLLCATEKSAANADAWWIEEKHVDEALARLRTSNDLGEASDLD